MQRSLVHFKEWQYNKGCWTLLLSIVLLTCLSRFSYCFETQTDIRHYYRSMVHTPDTDSQLHEPVYASMVSRYPKVASLERVAESLKGQVDRLNVFLEGYTEVPEYLVGKSWISYESSLEYGPLGDWGKLLWSHALPIERAYHFLVDEDVIYPPDYVQTMQQKLRIFGRDAIISAGGRRLVTNDFISYTNSTVYYHFADLVTRDIPAMVLSMQSLAYRTEAFRVELSYLLDKGGAAITSAVPDVTLSLIANIKRPHRLYIISHPANWLQQISDRDYSVVTPREEEDATEDIKANLNHATDPSVNRPLRAKRGYTTPFSTLPSSYSHPTLATLLALFQEINQNVVYMRHPSGANLEGGIFLYPQKLHHFYRIGMNPFYRTVCEIGFNAGHSAITFLHLNPNIRLVAFDLFEHTYSQAAVDYVKMRYPTRFQFVKGDSTQTVPGFHHSNPQFTCDIIHVDGGHDGDVPETDVRNMYQMVNWDSAIPNIFILDDTNCTSPWCLACNQVWARWKANDLLTEYFCSSSSDNTAGHCVGAFKRPNTTSLSPSLPHSIPPSIDTASTLYNQNEGVWL